MRVGVIAGGWSKEREISILTGEKVYASLKRQGFDCLFLDISKDFAREIIEAKIDVAFIALHGRPGEDGTIQGFLELSGIPYTGSGVMASAIGMDKITTKRLFEYAKIPTPRYRIIEKGDKKEITSAVKELGLPLVLKPRYEGSSVGVKILRDKERLQKEIKKAKEEFGEVFLEEYIPGMIATCGILNNRPLPVLELCPKRSEFYDYQAKYTKGETEFIIPARLPKEITKRIQRLSLLAHQVIGCRCYSRVDLVVYQKKRPYFLELNTLPGLTELSDLPKEAESIGISYDELILTILKSALPNQN